MKKVSILFLLFSIALNSYFIYFYNTKSNGVKLTDDGLELFNKFIFSSELGMGDFSLLRKKDQFLKIAVPNGCSLFEIRSKYVVGRWDGSVEIRQKTITFDKTIYFVADSSGKVKFYQRNDKGIALPSITGEIILKSLDEKTNFNCRVINGYVTDE